MNRTARCALLAVLGAVSLLIGTTPASGAPAPPSPQDKPPLAPTPPMGWNSWNKFGCDIDEELIRETADAMVSSGMADAGYTYVNIDDCWMAPERDAEGRLQADPERFPSGIKAVADYVHALGLKLGVYSSAGTATCQGLPASLDHETTDAASFAEWGVDLLKYDNCNNQGRPAIERYTAMADALAATGRDIVYSICEWGSNQPWEWAAEVGGHYWRTTGDISDNWGSVVSILDQQVGLEAYSGPNAWNDPDMLEVGNGGMSTEEYRAHMSLWSLLNSPLIAGNDLRSMDDTTRALLTDPDVIAVNQDWAGTQGHKIADSGNGAGDLEVWAKPTSAGGAAVVLFNRGATGAQVATTAADLGLPGAASYEMRDLWADTTTVTTGNVRASVPAHGAKMFVVAPGRRGGPAVTTDVRTAGYVEPGESFTTTVRVTNDGRRAVRDVRVALTAPAGWQVRPDGSTSVRVLPPGRGAGVDFTVTAPAGAPNGTHDLTADVRHRGGRLAGYGAVTIATTPTGTPWLSDLGPVSAQVGWGELGVDESVDGNPLTIAGVTYAKGIAPHAASEMTYYLGGHCTRFTAGAGIDDEVGDRGSVEFTVLGDGAVLAETGLVTGVDPAVPLDVDVTGVTELVLAAGVGPDNNNYDHSEWVDAKLTCA
ncbi:MAG: alpha-galactosidase [Actinophytocola sp.]|uniref:NPCBM/NEW2 domain-containing protein n=1 Tax=Actinophytocola sp. TaxID=1872138 RepID=UPI00132BD7A9|nr:NPCBM/NEW2 domain-containing protein [Actinophytocola sp.]MPZ81324.1 alpha-galactosidase [Actinophytocola sp.]